MANLKYDLNSLIEELQKFLPETAEKLNELLNATWSQIPEHGYYEVLKPSKDLLGDSTSGVLPDVAEWLERAIDNAQHSLHAPALKPGKDNRGLGTLLENMERLWGSIWNGLGLLREKFWRRE